MPNRNRGNTSFRYLFVLYIILFVISIPAIILSIPRITDNVNKYDLVSRYYEWKNRKSDNAVPHSFSLFLIDQNGKTSVVEREEVIKVSILHSLLEALLQPLSSNEIAEGLSTYIPPSTTLVGASQDQNSFFIELSDDFLSSSNITLATEQIKKTLEFYYEVESLTIISNNSLIKMSDE